jgi:hypothetical protein
VRARTALVAAVLILTGCSGAEDATVPNDHGTAESDEGTEIESAPEMDSAHECMDPNVYAQHPGQCDALGVTPDGMEGTPPVPYSEDTTSEATEDGLSHEWTDRGYRHTLEILSVGPAPENYRDTGAVGSEDDDTLIEIAMTVENIAPGPHTFGTIYDSDISLLAPAITVYHGENLYEAIGYASEPNWPTRLMPGTSATSEPFEFALNSSELDYLEIGVTMWPDVVGDDKPTMHRHLNLQEVLP